MNSTAPSTENKSADMLGPSTDTSTMVAKTDSSVEIVKLATMMHWYSSVVFVTIFLVIGLIGNILSLIVWNRKSMRSSTGIYLIAQAIADMSVLIFFFLIDSIAMMNPDIKTDYSYGVFFSYIGYPIFFLAVVISIWMTVGVTVDRYIQVCWIGRSKSMCNHKRALHGIFIICLLCFVINVPHFFTYHPISNRNSTDAAFGFTEFGNGSGSTQYEFWVHCMFLVLVPWLSIFSMNMFIIRQVVKTGSKTKERKSIKGKKAAKKAESQLTRLLLTVTFTFLILIALQCVTQCFFMLKPTTVNNEIVDEAFSVAKLGVIINSSINFFLYCLSGRRFRNELFSILRSWVSKGYKLDELSSSEVSGSTVESGSTTKSSGV